MRKNKRILKFQWMYLKYTNSISTKIWFKIVNLEEIHLITVIVINNVRGQDKNIKIKIGTHVKTTKLTYKTCMHNIIRKWCNSTTPVIKQTVRMYPLQYMRKFPTPQWSRILKQIIKPTIKETWQTWQPVI